MAEEIKNVGSANENDSNKAFKGSGVEGTKDASPGNDDDTPETENKAPSLKSMKTSLKKLEKEHGKKCDEESERGICGHVLNDRKARVEAIENLKADIEGAKR